MAVLQGILPCPPQWPLPISWRCDLSRHVLLLLTSLAFFSGRHLNAPFVIFLSFKSIFLTDVRYMTWKT